MAAKNEIDAYISELNQVWTNLINNAAYTLKKKYGDTGGAVLEVKTYDKGNSVYIEISDNGEGIRPEHLSKIWDPFFTTKEQGEGSGLGLGIVKNIINKHKGEIKLESMPGEGTRFIIRLPAEPGK